MPVDSAEFKEAMGRLAAGVTVVTVATDDGQQRGMTATAVCSLSKDPPMLLVCVGKGSSTDRLLRDARGFAVSILAEDQVGLSNRFAGWGDAPPDDLSDLDAPVGPASGAAWLPGAIAHVDCLVHAVLDGGDHHIYLGRIEAVDCPGERADLRPLLYFAGSYRAVGGSR